MNSNPAHESAGQPEKPYSVALHCLALALIGVAAIGIGLFLLPPAEPRLASSARGAAPMVNVQPSALRHTAGTSTEPAQTHPDYFTSRDDADEQPAQF